MDVVVQPPSVVRPGETIGTPLIISLKNVHAAGPQGENARCPVWAYASVIPGTHSEPSDYMSDHPGLLSGSLVDTPHEAWLDDSNVFEYVRFPRLAINQAGVYRIQISLLRMSLADIRGPPGRVENVGIVTTRRIHVDPGATLAGPSM